MFVADDFLTHDFSVYAEDPTTVTDSMEVFDAVIFCSSLHDLPDMENCLGRAASLLRSSGKLIVVHAQGAMVCPTLSCTPIALQMANCSLIFLNKLLLSACVRTTSIQSSHGTKRITHHSRMDRNVNEEQRKLEVITRI